MIQDFQRVLRTYWEQFLFVLPRLLLGLVLLGVIWIAAARLRTLLARKLGAHSHDPLLTNFLTQVARWVVVLAGLLLSLQIIGFSGVVGGLLAGAGLSAFLVGFAFKDIAENFLAGVILAFNRPFNINDTISIVEVMGRVKGLNLRTTLVKTFDGKDVFIPNATVLKEKVINYTLDGFIRQDFIVGIDFDDDVTGASKLIMEQIAQEPQVVNDDAHPSFVVIDELAASTVNLKVMFWTDTEDYRRGTLELRSRVMDRVKTALAANGYSLPPNITEVRLHQRALPVQLLTPEGAAATFTPPASAPPKGFEA